MPSKNVLMSLCILAAATVSGCATTQSQNSAPIVEATESSYFDEAAKSVKDDIFVGAQPKEFDLKAMKDKGITHVVNFRTPKEMSALGFDEAAILKTAGIDYTPIPIGGSNHPYSPNAMAQLSSVLQSRNGPVLLHCGSGNRASVVTVAWLVEEQGMPLNEALNHAQGWWPLRLEEVMGRSFTLVEEE